MPIKHDLYPYKKHSFCLDAEPIRRTTEIKNQFEHFPFFFRRTVIKVLINVFIFVVHKMNQLVTVRATILDLNTSTEVNILGIFHYFSTPLRVCYWFDLYFRLLHTKKKQVTYT